MGTNIGTKTCPKTGPGLGPLQADLDSRPVLALNQPGKIMSLSGARIRPVKYARIHLTRSSLPWDHSPVSRAFTGKGFPWPMGYSTLSRRWKSFGRFRIMVLPFGSSYAKPHRACRHLSCGPRLAGSVPHSSNTDATASSAVRAGENHCYWFPRIRGP